MTTEKGSFNFYAEQYFRFKNYHKLSIDTQEHVREIITELIHHFKLPEAKVEFNKNQRDPAYRYQGNQQAIFCFPNDKDRRVTFVDVCHEVAHHFQYSNVGNTKDDKELFPIMEQMLLYCENHNYCGENFGKNRENVTE